MKAITYHEYGPPEVLRIEELPDPEPQAGEVLIRVRAVEATKTDIEFRSFNLPLKWYMPTLRLMQGIRKPKPGRRVLGAYFSGEIIALGEGVKGFSEGQAVFGCTRFVRGCYCEKLVLPADYTIVPKPDNMSFAEAAAVPLGGLNALHFMRLAAIKPGEQVLVNGAGGCIGAYGVLIAKAMGAEVTAVDIGYKEEGLRKLGADHFINYEDADFTASSQRYDVIFDMVVNNSFSACLQSLKPQGRYLKGNIRLSDVIRSLFTGWFSDKTARVALAKESIVALTALKDMIEAGEIGSIVDEVYPMEQAVEAHRRVENEQRVGAIVIEIGEQEPTTGSF